MTSTIGPAEFTLPEHGQTDRSGPVRWIISHAIHHWYFGLMMLIGAIGNAALAAAVPVLIGNAFNLILNTPANVRKAKKAIDKAFKVQKAGLGFSLVEILSTCPTNWGLTPVESMQWVSERMIPYFPLGNFRSPQEVE